MSLGTDEPRRLAFTSEALPGPGRTGAAYANHRLATELVRRGHEVTVLSRDAAPERAPYHSVRLRPRGTRAYLDFARSLRDVDWSPYDIVITTGADALLRGSRTYTWVRLFHGSAFDEAIHATDRRFQLRMLLAGIADSVSMLRADVRVAVSENTKRWHPVIDHVVPNAVDRSLFRPGAKAQRPTILFVGSSGGRKRGEVLREAFRTVIRPEIPDAELWLVLADGPVDTGPGERVFHALPEEELADLYRRAWLYCSPASYEGFGIPYLEAMSSGTPVLSAPNAGARELSRGLRELELSELERLGPAAVALLRDPRLLTERSEEARRSTERFGWDKVAADFERTFVGRSAR